MARFVEIEARPLFAASLGLVAGITSVAHPVNALFLAVLLAVTIRRIPTAIGVCVAFLAGLIIGPAPVRQEHVSTGPWQGQADIISVPTLGARSEFCVIRADSGLFQLNARGHRDLTLGQEIAVQGTVRSIHGETAERASLEGVMAAVSADASGVQVLRSGPALFEFASSLRNSFVDSTDSTGNTRNVVDSIVIGSSDTPSPQADRENQSRSGAIHILSVSGLQVFLLAALFQLAFSWIPVKRVFSIVCIGLLLLIYACATGLHPATIRAVIVVFFALSAFLFRRQPDYFSALGVAALVTLFWQPWTVYTPGFQMSYTVVIALTMFWKPFPNRKSHKLFDEVARWIWFALRTSIIASLVAGPIIAYHYGFIPLLSPVTTLLIASVQPFVILFSLISWGLAAIIPVAGQALFAYIVSPLASYISLISHLLGGARWGSIDVPEFSGYWLLPYYAGCLILWGGFRKR